MSKKTRRQKMATETRKLHSSTSQKASTKPSVQSLESKLDIYFRKDLQKSIVICSAIFILEAALYLGNQYGVLSLINFTK